MSRLWSPFVAGLSPYVPGEQPRIPDLVKLNTNEHPYGPSPRALAALVDAADERLRLYPDPSSTVLREALAQREGLTADQVFVGNGSDEVLGHVFHAFFRQAHPVLFPDISYSFYPVYAGLYGLDFVTIPLTETFTVRVSDYDRPAGGVILANPNAPTGIALGLDDIRALLALHPNAVVVIDEAYVDFGADSAVSLIAEYDNLLVTQSFSKSRALAGLRVGMAYGQRHLIDALERVKNSFNSYPLGRAVQAAATASVEDADYFETQCQLVMMQRDQLVRGLTARGFHVLPSSANFVFATHPAQNARALSQALREHAVLVRHFTAPRIDHFLRITVGTPAQHQALFSALDAILSAAESLDRSLT